MAARSNPSGSSHPVETVAEKAIEPTKIQATRLSPDCANCTPGEQQGLAGDAVAPQQTAHRQIAGPQQPAATDRNVPQTFSNNAFARPGPALRADALRR